MKHPSYLESLEPWDHQSKFCLKNIQLVLDDLGNPESSPKVIHVGGTNGKGSVSVAIASILNAAGFSVGLNVSPHLVNLRERISINGELIKEKDLDSFLELIKESTLRLEVKLTYHEVLTVAAYLAFKPLDYAVMEVGLGGRFDASNCIRSPELAIITSISLDHTAILGKSLAKIAKEKAGIIKPNSRILIGSLPKEAQSIIARFSSWQKAELIELKGIKKDSVREYNDKIAEKAAFLLGISNKDIALGINRYYWPARMEKFEVDSKPYLIDAAHNIAAIEKLVENLKELGIKVQLIFGALQTKEWTGMLNSLLPYVDEIILLESSSSASVSTEQISEYLNSREGGFKIRNLENQYDKAIEHSKSSSGLTLITGSLYLIGDLWPYLTDQEIKYW